ncbi:ankyrin repeat and LEM domain-containing protein 2 [Anguilla anguilla]|uniref:ankyrin repeat and LEM domain-containing protein 2 n=1 Tax=Anguilla anguilla TaxID=7936 RepID=UPI0015A9B7AA|nr:ankyrin repeat and LEM domain-containing protein 2 [Anguilla anguilla]XP_035234331.1 ankyrin repeat and LEM domain-containing protein 2 [Anguilla anguilla]XP_035234332.1 ankyrin repeat and LEM domain-containing protein 2 [Anguilla anguilla]XP_035234333.1 ankyrin repeat and LEM domain-containing protein 2 [Anguilla anguilla]
MEAILNRLRGLSDDQLREEVIGADIKCGPITATTRAIFERKLARAILSSEGGPSETDGGAESAGTVGTATEQAKPADTSPDAPGAGEEAEFGYSMGLNPPEEEALLEKPRTPCQFGAEEGNPQLDGRTPSKPPQVSPPVFYGVCPVWEDVLTRNDRVHVYLDKKEALQAVKMMKGARFKPFSNREDAEKFAKGICDYYPSPSKSAPCVSPGKPGVVFYKEGPSVLEVETINRERANSYKSPRTQDITAKLRKAVEKGDAATFSELVWSNPRYLIGSGDNPTVVQEGCRYNAMHVAAKENQPGIAQLLLDTLENPEFMRLMYPDDQDGMLQKRIRYIVDLYLNTPDKAAFETPLHFACKFGCPEVVNVLCSHPDTDKNCKNKYDQTPSEVICERKNKTQEVKQKIMEYMEDRFYVPLLRATDNSSQAVIGAPWSPEPLEAASHSLPRLTGSPKDPIMAVRAFAGPLSPSKAEEFRRAWKTPPRDRAEHFHHILKSDPDRGAERVGRDLARERGHPWAEYWDFLGAFADLSSCEGLRRLDEYLSRKDFSERARQGAGENETCNRFKTPSPGKPKKFCNSISVGAFLDEGDDISLEEMKNRQNAALTSITAVCAAKDGLKGAAGGLEFHILPVSRGSDLIEAAAERDHLLAEKSLLTAAGKNGLCSPGDGERTHNGERPPRGPSCSPSSLLSPVSNLMVEFERMSLQDAEERPPVEWRRGGGGGLVRPHRDARDPDPPDLLTGVAGLSLANDDEDDDDEGAGFGKGAAEPRDGSFWRTGERSEVDGGAEERASLSSEEYLTGEEGLETPKQRTEAPERGFCARSRSWDHGGRDLSSSGSSGSSYKSMESAQVDFILRTLPHVKKGLFIEGDSPTKLDREVLSAIEAIEIDPQKYPSIHQWKGTVQTYSSSEIDGWPSPAAGKGRARPLACTPGSPGSSLLSAPSRFSPARHATPPDFTSPGRYSPANASYIQRIRLKHFTDPPL